MKKLLLLLLFMPLLSFSQLDIMNNSFDDVWVSIGYVENDIWYSEGWWKVQKQNKIRVYGKQLSNRYYYFYAYQVTGSSIWEGKTPFCTPSTVFKLNSTNCGNAEYAYYREIDVGSNKAYVIPLTEDNIVPGEVLKDIRSIERF